MEAGKRGITDIFNRARALEIPFFQRAYVWESDDWERFADDLIEVGVRGRGYFLGSIILKQRSTSTAEATGDARLVVDGQQRLTTLVLLFRVICDQRDKGDLFGQLFHGLDGELALKHNHNDVEVFEAIAKNGTVTGDLRGKYTGNRVLEAYDYFLARKAELAQIDPLTLVNHLYFVGIDLGADEDEQQIFDTINSLGVDLTTAELLKNELYGRADLELFQRTWLPAFESDEDRKRYWTAQVTAGRTRRENVDLFLQSYLLNQPDAPDDVRVGDLFSSYRGYLHAPDAPHLSEVIEDLTRSANLYRQSIDPELLDEAIDPDSPLHRLNLIVFGLQTTTVMPYILHLLRAVDDVETRAGLMKLTETYVMRRLLCGETSKYYNKFFAGLARGGVDSEDELIRRITENDDRSVLLPSDDEVRSKVPERNLTNAQARVVLYLIEATIRDMASHATGLNGLRHYTVEHVMPKKWPNHWGTLPQPETRERDDLVRKLGNLTLLSGKLNRTIRDSSWATKKNGTAQYGGLIRYGSSLEIFAGELEKDAWTEDDIRARSEWLAEQAIEVWPYPAAAPRGSRTGAP